MYSKCSRCKLESALQRKEDNIENYSCPRRPHNAKKAHFTSLEGREQF